MKVTVCELPNDPSSFESAWKNLCIHTREEKSDFVLLPEMPFFRWLMDKRTLDSELWFTQHAREYGKQGVQLLVCPRATSKSTWIAGGQTAAFASGAFCLSSNFSGKTSGGGNFTGVGWIIEPDEGKILGVTSSHQPFLTLEIDLNQADRAKKTYPRYVLD